MQAVRVYVLDVVRVARVRGGVRGWGACMCSGAAVRRRVRGCVYVGAWVRGCIGALLCCCAARCVYVHACICESAQRCLRPRWFGLVHQRGRTPPSGGVGSGMLPGFRPR